MKKNLRDIADYLKCQLAGDGDQVIEGLAPIETAKSGEITFVSNPKYLHCINESLASAFIIQEGMAENITGKNLIISKNSYYSFAKLLTLFHQKEKKVSGIDKDAFISQSAKIDESVSIYPNVFIGEGAVIGDNVVIYPGCFIGNDVTIGRNTVLYPNVVLREDSVIGRNVIIHAGAVIGSDGFGYAFEGGEHFKIPQVGKVVIEDNVEIGANVTIDRAAMGETVIGEGTKIDNLVMIAHNVRVGRKNIIVSQVGISGSTQIGDYVILGGQVGISGHLKIGDKVTAAARSGITGNVKSGETIAGFPAVQINEWRRAAVLSNKLPELKKRIIELEKRLEELEKNK